MSKNNTYINALTHPVFKFIKQATSELNVDSYAIGGFVRDYLLKREKAKDQFDKFLLKD